MLHTSDIKEAVQATQGSPIILTKLRLVYVAARVMFEYDPIDVGLHHLHPFKASSQSRKHDGHLDQNLGSAGVCYSGQMPLRPTLIVI